MTIVPLMETREEKAKREHSFFRHCEQHLFDNNVAWDWVPDWVIDEGIDLYFGPNADVAFYYDAIEKIDGGDAAQLVVNLIRNDTDDLEAASELKKTVRSLLVDWIHNHVDEQLETGNAGYDPAEQSREPY